MLDIQVIDDPAAATAALEPTRSRLLSELAAPASAATLATRVGLARQKVNYHLRALEAHGLVRLAQKRKWGGLTEPPLLATAASYVRSPSALGPGAADSNPEVAPAAARIAWSSWPTLCRRNPIPRSHHEREERSQRSPFRSGRIRSPRHAGGSVAGPGHRSRYFVLVRAN